MTAGNKNLNSAKTARKDEFYTQLTDIEKEMRYYRKHFKDKTVATVMIRSKAISSSTLSLISTGSG